MERYHATSVLSLTARHPARAERLDFKRFIFGRAVGRALINAGIGRVSAPGANRTCRDGRNDVNDPIRTLDAQSIYPCLAKGIIHLLFRRFTPSDIGTEAPTSSSRYCDFEALAATFGLLQTIDLGQQSGADHGHKQHQMAWSAGGCLRRRNGA